MELNSYLVYWTSLLGGRSGRTIVKATDKVAAIRQFHNQFTFSRQWYKVRLLTD